jgi:hypothetical protein
MDDDGTIVPVEPVGVVADTMPVEARMFDLLCEGVVCQDAYAVFDLMADGWQVEGCLYNLGALCDQVDALKAIGCHVRLVEQPFGSFVLLMKP